MRKQPNSDYCFVCGRLNPRGLYMAFYDNGDGEVVAEHVIPAPYQGYPGIVHGGVQAAILDEIVARVSFTQDIHHFMMSIRLDVKYRKPVPVETPLRFAARCEQLDQRRGRATGTIYLPDGTAATEASVLLAQLPPALKCPVAELGWKVDP